MSEVEFLSSSGVWVLLETQKRARKRSKGDLVLASPSENIKKTLDLAGLMHFMKIFDAVDAAVAGF
jgi:anti-anti-sigma factor